MFHEMCLCRINSMGHGVVTTTENAVPSTRLDAAGAAKVATTLQALATPSRLLILARPREGALPATELATEVGMEQSACSHQLRLLCNLGLVVGERRDARWSTRSTTTTSPNYWTRPSATSTICDSARAMSRT